MKTARVRRAILRALLVMLLLGSACTSTAAQTLDNAALESTTVTTGQGNSSVPEPSTITSSTSTPSTTTPSTATSSTATTTTLTPLEQPTFESVAGINTISNFSGLTARGLDRWVRSVPGVEDIRIPSTADGAEQPALWLAPNGDGDRPLLVILHSWSSNYVQHAGIPYAMWAQENGWAVVAPDFRGINDDPNAIGSNLAVQDVVDAIDYATSQEGVDQDRVYAVGYSGGGMMALLLAGRHPDKVTAVAAWGAPYDLVEFYRQSAGRRYSSDLWRGCGGNPTVSGSAQEECLQRSPMTHLDAAREQGVPVFIAQGIRDSLLSPAQGATAFNQLADRKDRIRRSDMEQIGRRILPDELLGSITTETFFGEGDPAPVFARQSAAVWLVFFQANHEMVYHATLRWFASDPR